MNYTFKIVQQIDRDLVVDAPTEGTLEDAIALAVELDVAIALTDAAGFPRGRVERTGEYRLAP